MKTIAFATAFLFWGTIWAQSVEQIKADRQTYLWGEGTGTTLNRADQEALQMLVSQISTQVESKFTLLKEEMQKAGKTDFSEECKMMVSTYSNATISNTERVVLGNEPDAKIFRYIKRSELSKIFEQRKRKIIDFVAMAENSAKKTQIADALKYYYWALSLLRGHPEGNTLEYTDNNGQQKLLLTLLPARINDLFASLSFAVTDIKNQQSLTEVVIQVSSGNRMAANFDYSYWDGKDWSAPVAAKDGVGFMEFYGENTAPRTETQIRAEYIFEAEARIDRELEDVMKRLEPVPFRNAYFNLKLEKTSPKTLETPAAKSLANNTPQPVDAGKNNIDAMNLEQVSNPKPYQDKVNMVLASLKTGNFETIKSVFTTDGFDIFNKLLAYGKARVLENKEIKILNFGKSVICRGPKMAFSFTNSTRKFVEDVVFYFDENEKISSLAFGLDQQALNSILEKNIWSQAERLTIVTFLESYKTAYALKRLDYISSIFADDALIIVGNMVKVKPVADNPFQNNSIIKYNRYNKQQYIKNLQHCFASSEYINLKFEDSDIRKAGQLGGRYGIQIKQNYFSANYADQGYLFLLVDLDNPDEPSIHVRTWQPEKNPDGSIYGIEDF